MLNGGFSFYYGGFSFYYLFIYLYYSLLVIIAVLSDVGDYIGVTIIAITTYVII